MNKKNTHFELEQIKEKNIVNIDIEKWPSRTTTLYNAINYTEQKKTHTTIVSICISIFFLSLHKCLSFFLPLFDFTHTEMAHAQFILDDTQPQMNSTKISILEGKWLIFIVKRMKEKKHITHTHTAPLISLVL